MAGLAVDTWTRTFRVVTPDVQVVVITVESDGVNEPDVSATVDGREVLVQVDFELLIDGLTPADDDGGTQ